MWQPTSADGPVAGDSEEPSCGTRRPSMQHNVLLNRAELGNVKKTTFNSAPVTTVYGMPARPDPEGARAVISSWRQHAPNPHARPGPDFIASNRAAADHKLVSSSQVRSFRTAHPITLKTGVVAKPAPRLPSDADPQFTYGKPAGYRSAEEVRNSGPTEPAVKDLVQGAYHHEWTAMNQARLEEFDVRRKYIKPAPTAATHGHALGASRTLAKGSSGSGISDGAWKMSKWAATQPRVTQYMGGWRGGDAAAAPEFGGGEGEQDGEEQQDGGC